MVLRDIQCVRTSSSKPTSCPEECGNLLSSFCRRGQCCAPPCNEQLIETGDHLSICGIMRYIFGFIIPVAWRDRGGVGVELGPESLGPLGTTRHPGEALIELHPLGETPLGGSNCVPHHSLAHAVVLTEAAGLPLNGWVGKHGRERQPLCARVGRPRLLDVFRAPLHRHPECHFRECRVQVDVLDERRCPSRLEAWERRRWHPHHERDASGVLKVCMLAVLCIIAELVAMIRPQHHHGVLIEIESLGRGDDYSNVTVGKADCRAVRLPHTLLLLLRDGTSVDRHVRRYWDRCQILERSSPISVGRVRGVSRHRVGVVEVLANPVVVRRNQRQSFR
mmetsp:Transcript_9922/g.25435  ORF Transcript_9922/g.25435 Transcript_9922/m.25435 type:complete len:335 (+) Transcript_9922:69-1073(+)